MKLKYANVIHPSDCVRKVGSTSTWQRMLKAKESTEAYMKWIVGKRNFNFWKEHWVLDGKLEDCVVYPMEVKDLLVSEAAIDVNKWESICASQLSRQALHSINEQLKHWNANIEDRCVWTANMDGHFTVKSAWEISRVKCSTLGLSKMMWHSSIPLKWSFLTWEAVRGEVSLDVNIQRKGINLASKCGCCSNPSI